MTLPDDSLLLSSQRHLFDMDTDVIYLNCAHISPQLHSVQNAGISGLKRKSSPWNIGAEFYFDECEQFRSVVGQLISAPADNIALVASASYGLGVAAANIEHKVEAGDKILVLAEQFPSNYYVWDALATRKGASLSVVPFPENGDWTTAIIRHIDSKTKVLALPNCHWTDGALVDLEAIRAAIGAPGDGVPLMVLDVTQSLGAYPFSVEKVQPDFMACALYKWTMCPYGMGILYVSDRFLDGTPIEYNWVNRRRSENLARLVDYCSDFQKGARRYDVGQRSNPILLPMATAAFKQLIDWNPARTSATLAQLNERLASQVEEIGLSVAPRQFRAGHMVGLRWKERWPDDFRSALVAANIHVSYRGTGMRVSPHLYNSVEDMDKLADFLRKNI